jgi:Integrase core domain
MTLATSTNPRHTCGGHLHSEPWPEQITRSCRCRAGVGASPVAERAQASHDLVDRHEPASYVAIALLDQVRIDSDGVDSDGVRLLAQRGQVDLDPQEPGDRLGVPDLRVGGGLLLAAPEEECRGRGAADAGGAGGAGSKTPLIEAAIDMAARNHRFTEDAIFHSDRGSNYTSAQFAATLRKYKLRQSVGRTGICYDNAMAESFFAALKNERVHRTQYPTRERARHDIARYIELWYNSRRRHSGLGYRTPLQVHNEYENRQLVA